LAVNGRAAAGVVTVPVRQEIYGGVVGGDAFREDPEGKRHPIRVSSRKDFHSARMVASRSHLPRLTEPLTRRLGIAAPQRCGSAGLKAALVASGQADLYVHGGPGLKLWDICAPEAIMAGAGGRFTDLLGEPFDYAAGALQVTGGLVASNAVLHPGVLSAVHWAQQEAERCAVS
jgi:3'(2'), 5'-bisphosphate nucleotidase